MKVLIAAGGSGGHIFPAVALARALEDRQPDIDIRFVASNKVLDKRILEKERLYFSLLSSNKMPYGIGFRAGLFFIKFFFDSLRAFFIIVSYKPDMVVGFGGYVSVPLMTISRIFGISNVAHEQNAVPGRANRFIFKLADKIAVSFEETLNLIGPYSKKASFTGNPIRSHSFEKDKRGAIERLGLSERKFTILVIGGSQGAHFLNETFISALSKLDEKTKSLLQVIHITGVMDYEWAMKEYLKLGSEHRVYSFMDRIEEAYNASDLVVTRSGASAIFELAFFGRPMILVPYPLAMSHQAENANVFSQRGAAVKIDEKDLSADLFKDNILSLLNDKGRLERMAESASRISVPEAADNLAKLVLESIKRS